MAELVIPVDSEVGATHAASGAAAAKVANVKGARIGTRIGESL
jgi:hypothetical protein